MLCIPRAHRAQSTDKERVVIDDNTSTMGCILYVVGGGISLDNLLKEAGHLTGVEVQTISSKH